MHGTKPYFSAKNPHLGDLGPPWATLVVQIMLQIAIQTEVTPGSAASELSSDLPEVTSDASQLSSGASEVSSEASEFSSDAPEHRSDAS